MAELCKLSASETAELMARGKITALALAESCLAQVERRDGEVQAWAHVEPALVLAQARACDREPRRSPVHGIPIGVKDIIDTADMPTEYGSPIYRGHRPRWDAACVAMWRAAGGIIMGKTETVEFAVRHPARTRNPRNLAHTPGGSSSGSAAAVADCMVPVAFGTQTGGSVIRPAAYCGVVGYKPTFNLIPRAGVKPVADTLDTVGLIARTVRDVALAFTVLTDGGTLQFESITEREWRIGFYRTPFWERLDAASASALERLASGLSRSGAKVEEAVLPDGFDLAWSAQEKINEYESYRALAYEREFFPALLSATLRERLAKGAQCTLDEYLSARSSIAQLQGRLHDVFSRYDVLLAPSATGEALEGLSNTGDALFNRGWTALHVPVVTVPIGCGVKDLPIGAQVIGPFGGDARTLAFAERVHRTFVG
ncbi:MAG: amidase [Betaproteobacteria bacterium]|nr:amidase [Betaproteobacteria bacterium]